jgi:hypothetical protein
LSRGRGGGKGARRCIIEERLAAVRARLLGRVNQVLNLDGLAAVLAGDV